MSFVHLHLHSQYSLLDGAITISGLLDRVKASQMPAVALTDHGNLHGVLEFYEKAIASEVQPIIGIEAYLTQGDRRDKSHQFPTNHIVLLAKNETGLRNLFRLVTLANFEGYYYKPRMDRDILRNHCDGLIATSACLNGVPARALQDGRMDVAEKTIREYVELFGDGNYYLELMNTGVPEQIKVNEGLIELSKRLSVPLVATNDCHYLNEDDARAHDALLCIGMGKAVTDQNRMKFSGSHYYVKTPQEMSALFSEVPEALSNTLEIAKKCDFRLKLGQYRMPSFALPENMTAETYLEKLAKDGLVERFPLVEKTYKKNRRDVAKIKEQYAERLEAELAVIRDTGFAGYFLTVADFINYAKRRSIPVGPGRGSAAGSLVAYALKITDIDPIPYNLLFERFLNKERVSMPDIDVDFCQDGRDEVIRYVSEKYGGSKELTETRVAQITTFGKMQARAVIRDVGRVLGMPYGDVDRIAKLVPAVLNITLETAFEQEPRFGELRKKDPKIDELLTIALRLEGLTRHASVHAAGVVISDDHPLIDYVPLYKGQHDEVVTQWDMKGVEKVGLIKFDFLGLKTLTLLDRAVKLVRETRGNEVDLLALDMNDPKVFELLSSGDTQGIFQLESSGMRDLVAKLKPSGFEDIIALVALYRPGPLGSGMVDDFINRKHGRTPIQYDHPLLEDILADTYGVILYQEQVMRIAQVLASYTLGEADLLRRAMGKKIPAEMEKQEQRFLEGCEKNKIPPAKAKRIFDLMAMFAGYGFNKSHSAAYGLISYQTAYMKAHYPAEFMAASMSIDRNNTDRIVLLMADCRASEIEVLPPDVNQSQLDFTVESEKIRFGLAAVKNVGEGSIESIIGARKLDGPFRDLFDFVRRVDLRRVNRRVIEALIKCGACDSMGARRAQLMASLDQAIEMGQRHQKDQMIGQESLFGKSEPALQTSLQYVDAPDWDESERLKAEKESVGFYISGHPLLRFAEVLGRYANSDVARLTELKDHSTARLGGIVSAMKEITTKKGERMAFVTIEDLTGSVEGVVFPKVYAEIRDLLQKEEPIFFVAKADQAEDQTKLIVEQATLIAQAHELFSGSVHIDVDASNLRAETLEDLKNLLSRYKGSCSTILHVRIPGRSETVISLPRDYAVAPSNDLIMELNTVLGESTQVTFV